ncbi:MAG: hypothetical protein J6V06_08510 [Clostridia bacterium]|nr:hypothetical protein [Clostridia bacterium]
MTALYIIIKYLTFPGALVRGMWEQTVCRWSKVPVEDNRYLRRDEMISHIDHEFMPKARGAFAICFVPFFFNMLGALIFGTIPAVMLLYLQFRGIFLIATCAVSYWFAFSLFVNAFPLIEDAMHMLHMVYKKGNILQKIFYAPGAGICLIGAFLERYCITFVIALAATLAIIF